MSTKSTGRVCVGAVMAALVKAGKSVLLPIDECNRYDLVLDEGDEFTRIQCKAGRLTTRDTIRFSVSSTNKERGKWKRHDYRGQAEVFGVYCSANDVVYLVPVGHVGKVDASLRLGVPKNNQRDGIRWAKDYEIRPRNSAD